MQLSIKSGSIEFGDEIIFHSADFTVNDSEHIGLIGKNGSGKTSLLRAIEGSLPLASGSVSISGGRVGTLSQINLNDNLSLEDTLRGAYSEIISLEEEISILEKTMGEDEAKISRFSTLTDRYRLLGGYTYKSEYKAALSSFGFSLSDLSRPLGSFSGGEKTKIMLLRLLLSSPSLLLLDEPTNNLDIDALRWLEKYLASYKGAFILVSHDREFLDKTVNVIYEIERHKLTRYKGNYSAFSKMKKQKYIEDLKRYKNDLSEAERLTALIERFRYKATKAAFAKAKQKQLDRLGPIEKPLESDNKTFHSSFTPEYESGDEVLFLKNLKIGYSSPLSTLSLSLKKGERLAVVGGNGCGKSTLIKTILGIIPAISGEMGFGHQVKWSYFSQNTAEDISSDTVIEYMLSAFPKKTPAEIRNILGAFLFRGEDVFKETATLSGGERVRLNLCKILASRPNFLILDEPTNHLDIPSKEALESILKDFSGTILFVSHDRFFIKEIADKILVLDKEPSFYSSFSEYSENYQKTTEEKKEIIKEKKAPPLNLLKEVSRLERKIATIERNIEEAEKEISDLKDSLLIEEVSSDYLRLEEISKEIEDAEEKYNSLLEDWEKLSTELTELKEYEK